MELVLGLIVIEFLSLIIVSSLFILLGEFWGLVAIRFDFLFTSLASFSTFILSTEGSESDPLEN